MRNQTVNIIGLIFDLIGVFFLFKYGFPSDVDKYKHQGILLEQDNENEKKK